jgi:hypothetical protein
LIQRTENKQGDLFIFWLQEFNFSIFSQRKLSSMTIFSVFISQKTKYFCFFTCLFLLFSASNVLGQTDTTQIHRELIVGKRIIIETKDGNVLKGIFLGRSKDGIKIQTDNAGEYDVPNDQITWMEVVDERMKDENYWFENPNPHSYLIFSSAISPKKGEFSFKNTYLVVNSINYGITDNFSLAAGFEITSALSATPTFYVNPKYNFKVNDNIRVGAGALYANVPGANFSGLGIGYGVLTLGNTDNNLTAGIGYGYVDKEMANKPVFTLSGMKRFDRRFALVSENWLVPMENYYGIYSVGVRYLAQRITVDLALINNPEFASKFILGIPYLNFVINFGKDK